MTWRAITLDPVRAALVAHGVTPWTTWAANAAGLGRVEVGDEVLVGAGARTKFKDGDTFGNWRYHDEHLWTIEYEQNGDPVVTCAVVARATVGAKVPIVEDDTGGYPQVIETRGVACIIDHAAKELWPLSDHLPYADWTPGRWAVRLDDVQVLEEAVGHYAKVSTDTEKFYVGESVPVRGRPGFSTPDPALVRACGGAGC